MWKNVQHFIFDNLPNYSDETYLNSDHPGTNSCQDLEGPHNILQDLIFPRSWHVLHKILKDLTQNFVYKRSYKILFRILAST